jgi:thioredoxin-like negative regulator of GroEL
MRVHLLTLVVLAGPLAAFAPAGDPPEVWHPTYESAAAKAHETGRPMLIHFYAEWCGPCRRMEAGVLNQPSVLDGLRDRVVAVKVNYDRRSDLVGRFNISLLPCDVLVAPDGEVLLKTTGYAAETTYVERVARLAPAVTSQDRSLVLAAATLSQLSQARQLGAVQQIGTGLLVDSGL